MATTTASAGPRRQPRPHRQLEGEPGGRPSFVHALNKDYTLRCGAGAGRESRRTWTRRSASAAPRAASPALWQPLTRGTVQAGLVNLVLRISGLSLVMVWAIVYNDVIYYCLLDFY